jgi:hypothetical protein
MMKQSLFVAALVAFATLTSASAEPSVKGLCKTSQCACRQEVFDQNKLGEESARSVSGFKYRGTNVNLHATTSKTIWGWCGGDGPSSIQATQASLPLIEPIRPILRPANQSGASGSEKGTPASAPSSTPTATETQVATMMNRVNDAFNLTTSAITVIAVILGLQLLGAIAFGGFLYRKQARRLREANVSLLEAEKNALNTELKVRNLSELEAANARLVTERDELRSLYQKEAVEHRAYEGLFTMADQSARTARSDLSGIIESLKNNNPAGWPRRNQIRFHRDMKIVVPLNAACFKRAPGASSGAILALVKVLDMPQMQERKGDKGTEIAFTFNGSAPWAEGEKVRIGWMDSEGSHVTGLSLAHQIIEAYLTEPKNPDFARRIRKWLEENGAGELLPDTKPEALINDYEIIEAVQAIPMDRTGVAAAE